MQGYKQLSFEERVKIAQLRQSRSSTTEIAAALKRSKSTISRELRRNQAPPGEYWPDRAQSLYKQRRKRGSRIDRDQDLKDFVLLQLRCHAWSPEQISGYLKYRQQKIRSISHESLYQWIYGASQKGEKLYLYLTRHKKKRGLRKNRGAGISRIPQRISIHERPKIINRRKQFGHWEADLMSCSKNKQHMLVLRERMTMFTKSTRLDRKTAQETKQGIENLLIEIPHKARRSITFDNGGEFAQHHTLKNHLPGLETYFCDAYASWQKGGIENTNGRLRRDFPRSIDLKNMTQEDFDESIDNYNSTPRKSLKWMTPLEIFNKNLNRVALHS